MGEVVQFPPALKRGEPLEDEIEDVHIYLIANGTGHIKVGISGDPPKRMRALQQANATRLRLLHVTNAFPRRHALIIEQSVHDHLKQFALGHEWFAVTRRQALKAICEVGEAMIRGRVLA